METKSKTNGDVFDGFYDDDIFDGRDIVSTAAAAINVNDGTAIINSKNNNNNNSNNTSVFDEGRAEGEKEGLLAGFKDGRIIGQRNGIDYGMEIGFALGLIEAVRKKIVCSSSSSSSSSFVDSVLVSVTKLEKAISEFPVDEDEIRKRLFRSGSSIDRKQSSREENEDDDEEGAYNNDSNNSEKEIESKEEDVREILQRIRARCKVLTAKLGIPHHSLKNVMKPRLTESINNKNEGNDNGNGSISQEW